jgi:hypothetical protein
MPTKVEPEHLFGAGINMKLVVQSSSNVISSRHIAFYLREYILRWYCSLFLVFNWNRIFCSKEVFFGIEKAIGEI